MSIPGKYRASSRKDRIRAKARIARDADRQRRERSLSPVAETHRRPMTVLLALGILSVVGSILVWQSSTAFKQTAPGRSREDIAEDELYALRVGLELFRHDCGRYPDADENLEALVLNPGITNWGGHYLTLVSGDPWKRRYHYGPGDGDGPILFSGGPDRTPNTPDDIVSPQLAPEEIAEHIEERRAYVRAKRGY